MIDDTPDCPECSAPTTVRVDMETLLDDSDATTRQTTACTACEWSTTEERDVSLTHAPDPDADDREKES